MKLEDYAKTVGCHFVRTGFNPETEQTSFVVVINHQSFDFHCGLMACIPRTKTFSSLLSDKGYKTVPIDPLGDLRKRYKASNWHGAELQIFDKIRQGSIKAIKNVNVPHVMRVFEDISQLCRPTAYDFLYCVQSDSQAADMNFNDFCSEFGYNNDSIKDLGTYNACVNNARKLRLALGDAKYKELMECEPD